MSNEADVAVLKELVRILTERLDKQDEQYREDIKAIRKDLQELLDNQNKVMGATWTVRILFAVGGALASAVTWILTNMKPHG